MKNLHAYLKNYSDSNPSDCPIDWDSVSPYGYIGHDLYRAGQIWLDARESSEGTLIILNGAAPHLLAAVPCLNELDIAFVPHYVSKIGRCGQSSEDAQTELRRHKDVFNHFRQPHIDGFLEAYHVEDPKSVSFGLMEVPPHHTGQPNDDDYDYLRKVVQEKDRFGIKKVLFIGEDIYTENFLHGLYHTETAGNLAIGFLRLCKEVGLEVDVAKFSAPSIL